VAWRRGDARFVDGRYPRAHEWRFDGGAVVPASASPHVVPVPLSTPTHVDPEEALVAAASSCHMLWFLSLAAAAGHVVDEYVDDATGTLGRGPDGRIAFTRIALRPRIAFGANPPDGVTLAALHRAAHERCFVAASLRAEVVVEPARG
jgi:organic hydroperoxide reductase OsmC/OhrA